MVNAQTYEVHSHPGFIKIVDAQGKTYARANKLQAGGWDLKLPGLPYRNVCESDALQAMAMLAVTLAL
jgi:hypothetical protein